MLQGIKGKDEIKKKKYTLRIERYGTYIEREIINREETRQNSNDLENFNK